MKILVTGGCGFIGRHLVHGLLERGASVHVLDNFSSGIPERLPAHPRLTVVEGCVTDAACVREAVRRADKIFHLAAMVGQVSVSEHPDRAVEISSESVRHLNAFAPDVPLVLFSSSAVYGLSRDKLCSEDDATCDAVPIAYDGGRKGYAYGKWISERIAEERAPGSWLTVRPFNVIGPGQVGTYGMVVPRFVRAALTTTPMTLYGTGRQTRSFGDVRAFVTHLLALDAAWASGETAHSVYNIGTSRETSIKALADAIDQTLGLETARRYMPFEQIFPGKQDVDRRRPDLTRIQAQLGPLVWPSLDETIRDVAAEIRREAGIAGSAASAPRSSVDA